MTVIDDDRSAEEVREKTIEDLLDSNDLGDLQQMRREMRDKLEDSHDDQKKELLEYRLDILLEAIDQLRT
jgi:hypothetical protein